MTKTILKSDLEIAQKNCSTATEAAQYLNISYNTYKKWAKYYGLFNNSKWKTREKNKELKKATHTIRARNTRDWLERVLDGREIPNTKQNRYRIKEYLIRFKFLEPTCNACGFDEERITDRLVPLLLDHIDGDTNNWRLENLQFLCFNCTFLQSKNVFGRRKKAKE